MSRVVVLADSAPALMQAQAYAARHHLVCLALGDEPQGSDMALHFSAGGTYLSCCEGKKRFSVSVDFVAGKAAHRRRFGGGKGQLIAKAVGVQKNKKKLRVLDCTAGQGGDAFVFASMGCRVHMLERDLLAYTILEDALHRAHDFARDVDASIKPIVENLSLECTDAVRYLNAQRKGNYDVVYLDPMFPERKKSALVKKEMQLFHRLIGADEDAADLLPLALSVAEYRVVVKRPKTAPHLADTPPSFELSGKSTRFDIYVNKSLCRADSLDR